MKQDWRKALCSRAERLDSPIPTCGRSWACASLFGVMSTTPPSCNSPRGFPNSASSGLPNRGSNPRWWSTSVPHPRSTGIPRRSLDRSTGLRTPSRSCSRTTPGGSSKRLTPSPTLPCMGRFCSGLVGQSKILARLSWPRSSRSRSSSRAIPEVRAIGKGSNVLGSPLAAIAHLIALLSKQPDCQPLQANELVTTGTITTVQTVLPGETWTTHL